MATNTDAAGQVEDILADGAVGVPEAMRFLSLSQPFLYVLMDRGELPYSKAGRKRLIPRKALVAYLAKTMVGAT